MKKRGTSNASVQRAKVLFKDTFVEISSQETGRVFSEAAFPSYAHANPLIEHLFWGRLAAVQKHYNGRQLESVLDFGCGSGIMSYILSGFARCVVATDIEPVTFHRMAEKVGFPTNLMFVPTQKIASGAHDGSFEGIVALDVLEHVPDLPEALALFSRLLKPGGEVVISGPTENMLYRFGRRIAGKRFTGDYHLRNIRDIREECGKWGALTPIKTLYPFMPFFEIFSVRLN